MRLLVFTLIFFYSCSQNITADSEITFTVPEGHFAAPVSGIKMKATLALKAYYSFSGIGSSGNMAAVFIITDSLKTMTYRTVQGDGSMFSLNNISYSYINTGDYIEACIYLLLKGGKQLSILDKEPLVTLNGYLEDWTWIKKAKYVIQKFGEPITTSKIADTIIQYEPDLDRGKVVGNISAILTSKNGQKTFLREKNKTNQNVFSVRK